MHKAGFVNIVGNPNAGKSTLMNVLVGEKISIITSKAQTTRHRIMGIVNSNDFQIVYSDTPGAIKPNYKLQQSMMEFVNSALTDADILLFVTDITDEDEIEARTYAKIKKATCPVIVLINKTDLVNPGKVYEKINYWKAEFPTADVLPISALNKVNTDIVFDKIISLLPESPPYFDKDALTDKPEKFFIAEIIREKIFLSYKQEIPYSTEVVIESFKEDEHIVKIRAEILVERDSQKGIIIGHKGEMLKRIGTNARKDMEAFLEKKVFLEMFVKVAKDWRSDDKSLRKFGYNN